MQNKFLSLSDKQVVRDWPHCSAKLEFIITYGILIFHCTWYRKILSSIKLIQNCFCQRKCTAAAAYNLPAHVLQRIMLHRKYMGNFLPGHNSHLKKSCRHAIRNHMMCTTEATQRKLTTLSTWTYCTIASNIFNNVCYNITYDNNVSHPAS